MVVIKKNDEKLNLKRLAVKRVADLLRFYKSKYEIDTIYFNSVIDGITHYNVFMYYEDGKFLGNWFFIEGTTLLKIIDSLVNVDFYGTKNGKTIEIEQD